MKAEEQVTLLKNKKIGVGVGTPARLMELIDNGEFYRLPVFLFRRQRLLNVKQALGLSNHHTKEKC